ncbi:GLPGLI family protein [Aquimarina algiphila]|uniref:GLPGLI family protein n=1 Tax=Aquimarina algiphila TaxID=2047982 RepID=UPI00232B3D45|nr:GLPGLI family protein [Aquimarina algiphila]
MNKYIFFFLVVIATYRLYAQEALTAIVDYNRIINNTTGTSFGTHYRLYFDNETSMYERIGDAKKINKNREESYEPNEEEVTERIMKTSLPFSYYYTNIKSNNLIFRETIVQKSYIVQDTLETIPWKLQQEHKKIANYDCQKAIAKYRGREYTVWFTTEITVSHGPWKLRGLPGLILEVTEETGKYEFRAIKINLNPKTEKVKDKLQQPDTKGIVDLDKYKEVIKNKAKEERAMLLASLPRGAKLLEGCDECPDPNNRSLERFE